MWDVHGCMSSGVTPRVDVPLEAFTGNAVQLRRQDKTERSLTSTHIYHTLHNWFHRQHENVVTYKGTLKVYIAQD